MGKGLTYKTCSKQLTRLKKEFIWLREVDSIALQSSLQNLADSYIWFFKNQNLALRFKSKKNNVQSYTTKYTNENIAIKGPRIKLPKLGLVRFAKSSDLKGRILHVTIRRQPSGKYVVSILVETEVHEWPKTGSSVGIDVGLKDFAILSDETIYRNPKFLRTLEKKLTREQRILARRKKGSSNRQKQRIRVARLHEKIVNARADYLHKISTAQFYRPFHFHLTKWYHYFWCLP